MDLLVNSLIDFPERQTEITQWQEFVELPKCEQARLLRLMATMTIIHGQDQTYIWNWLDLARRLTPTD